MLTVSTGAVGFSLLSDGIFCKISWKYRPSLMKLFSFCSSTRAQRPRAWKHRPGFAQFLLYLQPSQQFHQQTSHPACDLSCSPTQPPTGALQAQFRSHCPAQRVAPPEVTRVFQPGHASAGQLLSALWKQRVPLQGPNGKQECGAAGAEWWAFKEHLFLDLANLFKLTLQVQTRLYAPFPFSRLGRCNPEAQLPGFCILPGTAGTTSVHPGAARRCLPSSSSGHSCGGDGKQRPSQLLVAMQRGSSAMWWPRQTRKTKVRNSISVWEIAVTDI